MPCCPPAPGCWPGANSLWWKNFFLKWCLSGSFCLWYLTGTDEDDDEPPAWLLVFAGLGLPGEGVRGSPRASSGEGAIGGGPSTALLSEPRPLSGLVLTPSVERRRLSSSVEANATNRSKPELIRSCQSASVSVKFFFIFCIMRGSTHFCYCECKLVNVKKIRLKTKTIKQ